MRWRFSEVIFIPKAGKKSHTAPADLRLISMCSFMLKIMERLIDLHLKQTDLYSQIVSMPIQKDALSKLLFIN